MISNVRGGLPGRVLVDVGGETYDLDGSQGLYAGLHALCEQWEGKHPAAPKDATPVDVEPVATVVNSDPGPPVDDGGRDASLGSLLGAKSQPPPRKSVKP